MAEAADTTDSPLSGLDRRRIMAGLIGLLVASDARANTAFPTRPLSIMVPAAPGSGSDQIARLMQYVAQQERLATKPIEVINRGGGGGGIALSELVARRVGDPHTVMAMGAGLIGASVAQDSPFRVVQSEPIARLVVDNLVVAVPTSSPFATLDELLGEFQSRPESVVWCGGSAGTLDHLLMGLIAEALDVPTAKLRYIAYAGGGAASAAMLAGQVSAGVNGYSEWGALGRSGQIRILAAASPERFGDHSIATIRESGLDVELQNWHGILAPPGLRDEHLAWWTGLIEEIHASNAWVAGVARYGLEDGFVTGAEFRQMVAQDQARLTRVLERLGIGPVRNQGASFGLYGFAGFIGVAGVAAVAATIAEKKLVDDRADSAAGSGSEALGPRPDVPPGSWTRFITGAGLILVYIIAFELVGFLIATPLFVAALAWMMRSRRLLWDIGAGLFLTAGVWLLFTRVLHVNLP